MNNLPAPVPDQGYSLPGPVITQGGPGSHFRIQKFLAFLLRFWWVPLITLTLSAGGVYAWLRKQPPTYVSRARMHETEKLRLPDSALFTEDQQNYIGTVTELLRSRQLRQLTMARLQTTTNAIPKDQEGQPLEVKIQVVQAPRSMVFEVQASSSDPAFTQLYLDALLMEYIEYKKNYRKVVSGDTLASISEQVQKLERELKNDQEAFAAFQRTNNLAIMQEEATVAGGHLARLKTQVSDLQLELQILTNATSEQVVSAGTNADKVLPLVDPAGAGNKASQSGSVSERQGEAKELELLKMERAKLSEYLRPKHPKIVKLDAEIERGEKLLQIYRKQTLDQLQASRQGLELKLASIQSSILSWQTNVIQYNERIAEAERLKMNVNRSQSLYDRLVNLLQNVDISRSIDRATLAILDAASPAELSRKQEIRNFALASLLGLGAGLGIVFLIAVRDDRFTSVAEVTERLGDAIVGQVPDIRRLSGVSKVPLLEHNDERHTYVESYRSLRSAILFLANEGERPKVLLVTSSVPSEGKSTIIVNLAHTLAMGGARVLLVDGDMRKGVLHKLLGLQRGPGLAELPQYKDKVQQLVQTNSLPNLFFISRGESDMNPGDFFLNRDLEQVIGRWRKEYDYVLIDSPPVFAADDATTLAPKVDGVLVVVRNAYTKAKMLQHALELLYQRQANILGLIFSHANASAQSYYYYKYADYHSPDRKALKSGS